jgi:putative ABC transport system permease protein
VFFLTYLRRELRRRIRQSVFVALGLAVGIGLVVTVSAASSGVKKAQAKVLSSLYGVGTDVTVTGKAPAPQKRGVEHGAMRTMDGSSIGMGPSGPQMCKGGKCISALGATIKLLRSGSSGPFGQSAVASIAKLGHVSAAGGGLTLTENEAKIPTSGGEPEVTSLNFTGVDLANQTLSPLGSGTITSGRSLKPSDGSSDVAVVDSGYAKSRRLKVGSAVTIGRKFTIVGIVKQPQGSNPAQVYIPLQSAQKFTLENGTKLTGKVNTIYVTAASAAKVSAVRTEIKGLLPGNPVTTASGLANQVTGSLSSAGKLANTFGKWLSILVLIAAFAVACLLTMVAVARRVREFGTLKALGWRSWRVVAQVLGESVSVGLFGGAVGVGLGYLGTAIIEKVAPNLTATTIASSQAAPGPPTASAGPRTISVPLSAVVSGNAIVLAVVLALVGGLLAGALSSWRIARLSPANALAMVG